MKEKYFFPQLFFATFKKGKEKDKDKEWKRSKEKGGNERQKETEKNKDWVLVKREKGLMQIPFLAIGKKNG